MQAELIIFNADIVTMDPLMPRAEALAVSGGRVIAVGRKDDIVNLAGPDTNTIDAGGRMLMPGLQDTHIHLQDSGFAYGSSAALDAARTIPDLQAVLSAFAPKAVGRWVMGVGWYTGVFNDANLTRQVLDAAVSDRPCFILGSDGHNACINSAACAAVGLVAGTQDPPGGHFVVDAAGEPTGMLHESALSWVRARMPAPSDADYAAGVRYGQAHANRHGITGVLDASVAGRHARVYRGLAEDKALTVRVAATARVDPSETTTDALARVEGLRRGAEGLDMFKIHSAKFFIDGVFENRTAVMVEPYSDAVGGNAPLLFTAAQIKELFVAFDAARFQIHTHVIGDGAVRAALDGLEAAREANGSWPSLHQLAHVQCLDPADVDRFAALGAVANIQPFWARRAPSTIDVTAPMIGPERTRMMYAFRTLLDARSAYVLSSDWGVTTLNPFQIMETAITRKPPGAVAMEPFLPEQALTREECLRGYTLNAAETAWRPADTGRLSVGCFADLIVIDRDFFNCDVHTIGETQVLLTLLAGREVHRAGSFEGSRLHR